MPEAPNNQEPVRFLVPAADTVRSVTALSSEPLGKDEDTILLATVIEKIQKGSVSTIDSKH